MPYLNSNFFIISFFLLYASGCDEPTYRYQKETGIFNRYLVTTGLVIEKDKSCLFVCAPNTGCGGCREHLLNFFDTTKNERVYLLTSAPENDLISPLGKSRIYYDATGKLDRINLPIRNASVIFYEQGKISDIVSVNPSAPDSIDYRIKEWINRQKESPNGN
jgi:hypothetical protein